LKAASGLSTLLVANLVGFGAMCMTFANFYAGAYYRLLHSCLLP